MNYPIYQQYDATQVLVADDDRDDAASTASTLRRAGCRVRQAADGDRAIELADSYRPHVIFLNVSLPKQSGWLVCAKLKLVEPAPFVVLMGADSEKGFDNELFASIVGADKVLYKPLSEGKILITLRELIPCGGLER